MTPLNLRNSTKNYFDIAFGTIEEEPDNQVVMEVKYCNGRESKKCDKMNFAKHLFAKACEGNLKFYFIIVFFNLCLFFIDD